MLEKIKKIIPKKIFKTLQPVYHFSLSLLGAIIYQFPSNKLIVIEVTGTKGKTSTTEIIASIFRSAKIKTASLSTLRFVIDKKETRNKLKMTTPGRFFVQKFLKDAVDSGCKVAVIEMSSEASKQYRHRFINMDALIFTNLSPEHIESHGSYEKYVDAKVSIGKQLKISKPKKINDFGKAMIANKEDKESDKFFKLNAGKNIRYSINDLFAIKKESGSTSFQLNKTVIHTKLIGEFNLWNIAGAIACAKHFGIKEDDIKKGIESIEMIRGRAEKVDCGQNFEVIIDYAHTKESLEALYNAYNSDLKNKKSKSSQKEKKHLICVLGNTGGGRDKWKRPEMGKIADLYCNEIILTNEDPYDEDPMQIIEDVKSGIKNKPVEIILNRREAINKALKLALSKTKERVSREEGNEQSPTKHKVSVLITGKGTDPYIMGPNGTKEEWDDATVAREELYRIMKQKT